MIRYYCIALAAMVFFVMAATPVVASDPSKPIRGIAVGLGVLVKDGQSMILSYLDYYKRAQEIHWEYTEYSSTKSMVPLEGPLFFPFRATPYEADGANKVLVIAMPWGQGMAVYTDAEVGLAGQTQTRDGWCAFTDKAIASVGGDKWVLGKRSHFKAVVTSADGVAFLRWLEAYLLHHQVSFLAGKSQEQMKKLDRDPDWRPAPFFKIFNTFSSFLGVISNVWAGNMIGARERATWKGIEGLRQIGAYAFAGQNLLSMVGAWDAQWVHVFGMRADKTTTAYEVVAIDDRLHEFRKGLEQMERSGQSAQLWQESQRLRWKPPAAPSPMVIEHDGHNGNGKPYEQKLKEQPGSTASRFAAIGGMSPAEIQAAIATIRARVEARAKN